VRARQSIGQLFTIVARRHTPFVPAGRVVRPAQAIKLSRSARSLAVRFVPSLGHAGRLDLQQVVQTVLLSGLLAVTPIEQPFRAGQGRGWAT
jgi:hypothetical protein